MSKILELRSKRNALWEQTKAFLEKNRGENGLVAPEAVEQYNKMAPAGAAGPAGCPACRAHFHSCPWHAQGRHPEG